MNKVTFFVNTMISWLNRSWPRKMFSAVYNVSTAEDILEPVYPTSQHTSPSSNPLRSVIPVYPSRRNMTVHQTNAGTPNKCHGFLLQCSLYFSHQLGAPTIEKSKVATVISLLTGLELEWATAVWERGEEELESYKGFVALFKCIFDQQWNQSISAHFPDSSSFRLME